MRFVRYFTHKVDFLRSQSAFCTLFHAQNGLPALKKCVLRAISRTNWTSCTQKVRFERYFTHKVDFLRSKSACCTVFHAQTGLPALNKCVLNAISRTKRTSCAQKVHFVRYFTHKGDLLGLPLLHTPCPPAPWNDQLKHGRAQAECA